MKKFNIIFTALLLFSLPLIAQEREYPLLLDADSTWTKEIFQFPIGFAQDIPYKGYEEARFPVGWSKPENPNFWSYAFAWYIDAKSIPPKEELEANLQIYFTGLMNAVNKEKDRMLPKTSVELGLVEGNGNPRYVGKIDTFDAFATKAPITLHVYIETYYCKEENAAIILFRFSPKDFMQEVWLSLRTLKLHSICP